MDSIREYFVSVTVCAILCSVATGLFEKNSSIYKLMSAVCGLILAVTLMRPIADIQLDELTLYTEAVSKNAQVAVAFGESYRSDMLCAIIKEETEAYILDKAQAMHCTLDVEVIIEKSGHPIPAEVYITGNVLPEEKEQLQAYIAEHLNIAKEFQIWIQ